MSQARQQAFDAISVGDIIYGIGAGGQEKLLLVEEARPDSFRARHVTSQVRVTFGRDGKSRRIPTGGSCTIISTAKLPAEEYEVAIGLDRKKRNGKELTDGKLSKAEIDLLLTMGDFFKARPLPE